MAKSWATSVHNFNESLWYSMKVFSVLNFWFEQNFVSFMTKIFCFMQISQLPSWEPPPAKPAVKVICGLYYKHVTIVIYDRNDIGLY